ncbi:MAG: nucleoid-associated protein [Armatimonadota bacterium]
MQDIQAVELVRLVIHGINNFSDEPELADKEEILSEGLRHFFEEHIRNSLKSSSAKTGKFNGPDTTIATCVSNIIDRPEDFVEQCKVIGLWFAHQMERSSEVQTFLAVGLFIDPDTDERYIALLKLDPVRAFVKKDGDATKFEQIQILPDPSKTLFRYAIVRPYSVDNRFDVIYRNQSASREEDPEIAKMWTEGFLECFEVPSPKQMTQLVVKETEKWIQQNDERLEEEDATKLRNGVRTMAQSEEMNVESIAEAALKQEELREEYIGRLLDKGLTETVFSPDRQWAERNSRKTTYVCDDNVQITGPSDVIDEIVQILPKSPDKKTRIVIETHKFLQK